MTLPLNSSGERMSRICSSRSRLATASTSAKRARKAGDGAGAVKEDAATSALRVSRGRFSASHFLRPPSRSLTLSTSPYCASTQAPQAANQLLLSP